MKWSFPERQGRRRVAAVGLGLMILAVLAARFFEAPTLAPREAAPEPPAAGQVERSEQHVSGDGSGAVSPLDLRPGPRIESIELDKREVCFGEENFANVRARDQSGSSDRLIVSFAHSREMGFRLPFRIQRGAESRELRVIVNGPGGPPVSMALPAVRVKDCDEEAQATIEVALAPRSAHAFVLTANVETGAPANRAGSFEPVSYTWDFGDGTHVMTREPTVSHSYEGAPQKTRFSYFLINVKVSARDGRVASGSRSYGFPNFGFGAFVEEHRILLMSAGGLEAGDVAAPEKLRLYHGYEHPVTIDRIRTKETVRGESGEQIGPEYAGGALLGVANIPPGTSATTLDLAALRPTAPGHVRELEILGHSGDVPARGKLVLTSTTREMEDTALATAQGD